ncbi:MAG: AAA family ATPase [Candidatus Kapaibacterium sp.]
MTIDPGTIEELLTLVRRAYPGWTGFDDDRFQRDEIAAKRSAAARAADLLGWNALQLLMSNRRHDEIIERFDRIGRATSLLHARVPGGDLGFLHRPDLPKEGLCEALIQLLYGPEPSPVRLERYLSFARGHRLPNRWAFPSLFLFLLHPESEMFVKPTVMLRALDLLGLSSIWREQPDPGAYAAIIRTGAELLERLEEHGARDMIDVQSLLHVAALEAAGERRKAKPKEMAVRYWKISPGEDGWQWEESRRGNFIGVGWELFGDISRMTRVQFDDRYREIVRSFPDLLSRPGWSKRGAGQLWRFAHIRRGDVVVANRGTTEVLGVGRVAGPYYFVPGQPNGHRLPVIWTDAPRHVSGEGWRRTLLELEPDAFAVLDAAPPAIAPVPEYRVPEEVPVVAEPPAPRAPLPAYSVEECAEETGFAPELLSRWIGAIERKGQGVIYGPPGTGKTFIAERLARHMAGGGDGFTQLLQLHSSYAYEDFVLGIRPRSRPEGGLDYPLVPGRFLQFCEEARSRSGRCVLVLDEINRANISRVFGELMYLLEYRDAEVPLAGGLHFSIPGNVRIIGTMNTADRSIALVDHALRRRFAFLSLPPDYEILRRFHATRNTGYPVDRLVELIIRLNRAINDRHFEIGISYFLRTDLASGIEDIWRMEIEPYLEEYFFDQPARIHEFRWDAIAESLA